MLPVAGQGRDWRKACVAPELRLFRLQQAFKLTIINAGFDGLLGSPNLPDARGFHQQHLLELLATNDIPHTLN
jgi:hypothetical protein